MATALLSLPQVGQHSLTFVCKALGPPVLKWDLSVSLDQMAAQRGVRPRICLCCLTLLALCYSINGVSIDISASESTWSMYMSNGESILTGRDGAVEESL